MNEEAIFAEAVQVSQPQRSAFLDTACAGDANLRARVELLLDAHDRPDPFFSTPGQGPITLPDPPMSEQAGSVIGPYRLLQQIGEGGMGVVWMAEQTHPVQRKVALKVIKPGMDSRQVIARFDAERQALALMDHANIARVLDAGATEAGRPYFVMDLVKGVPITRYCDEHHLTPRQRLELFIPVCRAIQHAHQKGIIHRDLKPSNVLVALYDDKPVPKVIDFGVAKATGRKLTGLTLNTCFGAVVGTLEYMSPEQAGFNQLDIDTRSDIYSLGVLLYELLAGSPPFSPKDLEQAGLLEMLRVIREHEPSKPSTKLSSSDVLPSLSANRGTEPARLTKLVRGELDWIVMKALEKDRNRRYETASGFAMDVERYLADEPVQACPPSAWYRLRKFARRNKAAFAMASVVALALVALGVAGFFVHRNQLMEQQRMAEQKAHEQRLLDVQRENALERALMTAMSGDFDGADKAIGEAELLGVSTGQVRLLRGQVAYHRGDMEGAIQHLEQAVKLLPAGQAGAVAARAMLCLACLSVPQLRRFDEVSGELDLMSPISPEDYLFKGLLETTIRPERGLKTMDEAISRRDSVVARVARTEARANRALATGEVGDAELALEDAQAARAMLSENPLVLARSVYTQLVAAGIYEGKGRPTDSQRVLAQARRDVQALERFAALPFAAQACFEYFEYVGDEEAAYAMSGRGNQFRRAVMLYRRGEFAKALDAAVERSRRTPGFAAQVEPAFILTELPDGPARARTAFDEAKAEAQDMWQLPLPMILLLLGKTEEARRAFLQVRKEELLPWHDGWWFKLHDYLCSRITAAELLQAAGQSRSNLSDAHFLIGLWQLSEGDRAGARDEFQRCVATRIFGSWHWPWVRAFLARMEQDAAWPLWIPVKK